MTYETESALISHITAQKCTARRGNSMPIADKRGRPQSDLLIVHGLAKRRVPGCVKAAAKPRQKWYATARTKRFDGFCSCCSLPLLPQLACIILRTWNEPYSLALHNGVG